MEDLRTSEEWWKYYQENPEGIWDDYIVVEILDADGWDRKNFQYSWFEEKISYGEFLGRILPSTCMFKRRDS